MIVFLKQQNWSMFSRKDNKLYILGILVAVNAVLLLQWQHITAHCLEHYSHCVYLHLYCGACYHRL